MTGKPKTMTEEDLQDIYGLEWGDYIEYLEGYDMGWWSIGDGMVSGDTPADIMGDAVNKIIKAYEDDWGRTPHKEELLSVLRFVSRPVISNWDDIGLDGTLSKKTVEAKDD